jgi:hypothetical protein
MERFVDSRGYVQYIDQNNDSVREHQINAVAAGFDPHEVFQDGIQIHHLLNPPQNAGVMIDLPSNLCPVSREIHAEIHRNEMPQTCVGSVLKDEDGTEQSW